VREVGYDVDGWGTGTVWFSDRVLVWHELPSPRTELGSAGAPQPTTRCESIVEKRTSVGPKRAERAPISPQLLGRLRRYFAGERVAFADVDVDLDWCTPFQRSVAETLRAIPYGEVVTYGELAAVAGYPNAQRAAGTFCAHNRLPLVIPCHRVVAAGGLGSYGSLGEGYKRRLLALEGVRL
jgi:methylated-DNA-[protein]-cysteine S-methyltransferase